MTTPSETVTLLRKDRLVRLRAARLIREICRRLDEEENPASKFGTPWHEARLLMEALRD